MSSVKGSYKATNKEVRWQYLLRNKFPVWKSYNATKKPVHSKNLLTNMSSLKRS